MINQPSARLSGREGEALVGPDQVFEPGGGAARLRLVLVAAGASGTPMETQREAEALGAVRGRGVPSAIAVREQGGGVARGAAVARFFTSRMLALLVAIGVATGGVAYAA